MAECDQDKERLELDKIAVTCLVAAINDSQALIRSLDTKAQIAVAFLAIFYTQVVASHLPDIGFLAPGLLLFTESVIFMLALFFFGLVVYPRGMGKNKMSKKLFFSPWSSDINDAEKQLGDRTIFLQKITFSGWQEELLSEMHVLAGIRQKKTYNLRNGFIFTMLGVALPLIAFSVNCVIVLYGNLICC